jgi:anti-sigma regulatory factor (Ser/Thr protein kinase)
VAIQPEVMVELPADPGAARLARNVVRSGAGSALPPAVLDDLLLLVTEVVTNAVLHGSPPITMQVEVIPEPTTVKVAVSDGHAGSPLVRASDRAAITGRGMAVVDALASRWGVEWLAEGGKTIWFEVLAGTRPA